MYGIHVIYPTKANSLPPSPLDWTDDTIYHLSAAECHQLHALGWYYSQGLEAWEYLDK